MEFKRNRERYQFLKWGMQAFETFQLIPPGIGIVHQVNLEYLAKGGCWHTGSSRSRSQKTWPTILSGHARWNGFAHHDDQRSRCGRLGRRWNRSGSGNAWAAGLFFNAGSRRRASKWPTRRRRNRNGSCAAHHANAARTKSRREICRILRRRRGLVAGPGPRDDRQHVARVRRDDGIFSRSIRNR